MRKEFRIPSDLSHVRSASDGVMRFLGPLGLNEAVAFDIRLCLEEALVNAMKYGNNLQKHLPVELTVEYDQRSISIAVEDRGHGFDVKGLADCTHEDNLFKNRGRGVFLIHQLMDSVRYNKKGNSLLMVKSLKKENVKVTQR